MKILRRKRRIRSHKLQNVNVYRGTVEAAANVLDTPPLWETINPYSRLRCGPSWSIIPRSYPVIDTFLKQLAYLGAVSRYGFYIVDLDLTINRDVELPMVATGFRSEMSSAEPVVIRAHIDTNLSLAHISDMTTLDIKINDWASPESHENRPIVDFRPHELEHPNDLIQCWMDCGYLRSFRLSVNHH